MFSHLGSDRTNYKHLPWALHYIQGVKLSEEKEVQRETLFNVGNYQGYLKWVSSSERKLGTLGDRVEYYIFSVFKKKNIKVKALEFLLCQA